jgi:hypothetical protein
LGLHPEDCRTKQSPDRITIVEAREAVCSRPDREQRQHCRRVPS